MADAFLDPILERVARSNRTFTRAGRVTVIDAGTASMTVDCAGDVIVGVRGYTHFLPAVGDFVDLLCVGGSSWRALGVPGLGVAAPVGAPTPPTWTEPPTRYDGEVAVTPTMYRGETPVGSGTWTWLVLSPEQFSQGLGTSADRTYAGVAVFATPASVLPAGATITVAKLKVTRSKYGLLATPRVYQHAYTAQPVGVPSYIGTVWSPGTLNSGETGQWDLPSAWVAAWVAGTTKGFGVFSSAAADVSTYLAFSVVLSFNAPII